MSAEWMTQRPELLWISSIYGLIFIYLKRKWGENYHKCPFWRMKLENQGFKNDVLLCIKKMFYKEDKL